MNVDEEYRYRYSLRTICRCILAHKWLWAADGRAQGFREDVEELSSSIDTLPADSLPRYVWALCHLRSQLPDLALGRGYLASIVSTLPIP